ncbi:MAG TPA: DUF5916 domain-containing protein [Rhodanobacteraceae bacterium]
MQRISTFLLFAVALAMAATASTGEAHGSAPVTTRAPATIPDLAPWAGPDGAPGSAAWRHAARFAVDNEIDPGHNRPAPVATEVLVGYTKKALWLRFVAHDPRPDDLRIKYRQRDEFDNNDDYVGLIFSPFNDTQWGYEFFCSAGGTEMDMFRLNGNEYSSFDAIWYCHARRTRHGYTVTMQIPFRSLTFPHSDRPQAWRMLFFRNWARRVRHQITQIKMDYNSNCFLCQAKVVHTATPIQAHDAGLQIIPAATLERTDVRPAPAAGLRRGHPELSGGLDARWAIRPDLEWSATIHPDFSQVAPDVLQSTVNQRFAIYYPENRPFFRQGTWVFNTPGFTIDPFGADTRLVDTRQIADPHWASKLVGQVGSHAIGVLVANDAITNILLPGEQTSSLQSFDFPTRDTLLRYRHDFAGHSSVGMLATSRQGRGYRNRVQALDGTWQMDTSDTLTTQVARSDTTYPLAVAQAFGIVPGRVDGNAWALDWQRTRTSYNASLGVARVDAGFRADFGYLPQVGYTEVHPQFEYDWYAHDAWWNNAGLGVNYDWMKAVDGGAVLNRELAVDAFMHAVGQSHVVLWARRQQQYFHGRIFHLRQWEIDSDAQPLSWLGFELDMTGGDGVDYVGVRKGGLLSVSPSFTLTPGRHLKVAFVGNFEHMDIDTGRLYTARLYDLRVAWYFNARMFVRAIGQMQDVRNNVALYPAGTQSRSRTLATQWRFGYQLNPWTSLFAGFANNYLGSDDDGLLQQGRTYFLKVSYAFQL